MIVSIHQANHIGYLGLYEKIAASDVFVIYDNTQFARWDIGFQNRNKIRTKDGWMWITVPVKHNFGAKMNEMEIDNSKRWARKNWTSIVANYSKAPYFREYAKHYEEIFMKEWAKLADLNIALIMKTAELLGIRTKIVLASDVVPGLSTTSTDALIDICKALGAKVYLSGKDGKEYLEHDKFDRENIKIIYQDYTHPEYTQAHPGFEPYMCILDLIFNHGPESLRILKNQTSY